MAGGIAFATPEGKKMGRRVASGTHFVLYREAKDEWTKWSPRISLRPGGQVMLIKVQEVSDVIPGACTDESQEFYDDLE